MSAASRAEHRRRALLDIARLELDLYGEILSPDAKEAFDAEEERLAALKAAKEAAQPAPTAPPAAVKRPAVKAPARPARRPAVSAAARAAQAGADIACQKARVDASVGVTFGTLGVRIKGDRVTTDRTFGGRDLGPLAGCGAGVTGKSRFLPGQAVAAAILGFGVSNTPVTTFVVFADGHRDQHQCYDAPAAYRERDRFNLMADAAALAAEAGVPFTSSRMGTRQCKKCAFSGETFRDLVTHQREEHPSAGMQAVARRQAAKAAREGSA
jgi:hypothetical protein